jgi:hypothetical protein
MRSRGPLLFTADYPYGITRTAFRRFPKAEKIELMVEWFHQNYEDPAQSTPYETAEGGYQYIWGGPYDANDEIGSMFGGLVPDKWIEEAVKEVERDGIYDWAPVHRSENDYGEEPIPEPSLDDIPDEAGPVFGTDEDYRARQTVATALDDLQRRLDTPRPIGIGHNRPPEEIDTEEPSSAEAFKPVVQELRDEFEKPAPSIPLIKQLAYRLRDGWRSAARWARKKMDMMVDEAAKTIGKRAGDWALAAAAVAIEPHLHAAFVKAYEAVIGWLHIVTSPF